MSFSTSSRFSEYFVCSPSPTAYNIPSTFDENATNDFSAWTKPCVFPGHKCDDTCTSIICARSFKGLHASSLKKPPCTRRCSLDPGILKLSNNDNLSSEITKEKDQQPLKPRPNLQGVENKENLEKKNSSNIPRFKKQVTEGQAPSFLTRSQLRHSCCFPRIDEDDDSSATFNRHSVTRRSVKPVRKIEQKADDALKKPQEQTLTRDKPFNKSYVVLPGNEFKRPEVITKKTNNVPGEVHKNGNNLNVSESISKLLLKDQELAKELAKESRSKQYYDITSTSGRKQSKSKSEVAKLRPHDLFTLDDCKVIFLVNEEFIDDEYDSYIKGWSGSTGYLQVLQNQELYEMAKYLARIYLQERDSAKNFKNSPARRKPGKLHNKKKSIRNNENVWNEIESIVRAAIAQLEGEFRSSIYAETNEKLDHLIAELKSVVLKANKDIEHTCEHTAVNLISRLENVALKL